MAKVQLASLLQDAQQHSERVRCRTCNLVAEMSDDDVQVLEEAFNDASVSAATIARALQGYGFEISVSALSRHRRVCR